jgi:hypothetical protein
MLLSLFTLAVLIACGPASRSRPRTDTRTRNVVTSAELLRVDPLENLHAAIERLRPSFLHPRPGSWTARATGPSIGVFVDGQPAGGADVLFGITVAQVEEIRLVQATESDLVLGGGHDFDAIINVVLRVRRPQAAVGP